MKIFLALVFITILVGIYSWSGWSLTVKDAKLGDLFVVGLVLSLFQGWVKKI
jgi:hypothetical protein